MICTKAGYFVERRGVSRAPDFLEENFQARLVDRGDGAAFESRGLLRFYGVAMAKEIAGHGHRFNLALRDAFNGRGEEAGTWLLPAAGKFGITVNQRRLRTDAQRAIQFSRSTLGMAVSLLTEREYYAIYDG